MKKAVTGLAIIVIAGLMLAGCFNPAGSGYLMTPFRSALGPGWNPAADSAVLEIITPVENKTRNDTSGVKITSNAHSAAFPGILFVWDPKQNGNGYLKVEAWVFEEYEYFILTAKEANKYWDFKIVPNDCQEMTADDCYVFFIGKQEKNINMVFITEWKEKEEKPPIPVLYQIDIVAGSGGSIVTGISGLYEEGTCIEIEAAPLAQFKFVDWTCTEGELEDPVLPATVFIVGSGSATVTANFAPADPAGESYLRIKANPTVSVNRNNRYVFELELSDDIPIDRVEWSIVIETLATVDNGVVTVKNSTGVTQLWARDPVTGLSYVIMLRIV